MVTRVIRRPVTPQLNHGLAINRGLVGFWPLQADTIQGGQARDFSGFENNGALFGGPVPTPARNGTGLLLSGSNGVRIPTSPSLDITGNTITWGGWVNPANSSNYQLILGKVANAGSRQYALYLAPDTFFVYVALSGVSGFGAGGTGIRINSPWVIGAWNLFLASYDGVNFNIWLNGQSEYVAAESGTITSVASDVWVGDSTPDGGYNVVGGVSAQYVWNRCLYPAEHWQLYTNTSPTYGLRTFQRTASVLAPPVFDMNSQSIMVLP